MLSASNVQGERTRAALCARSARAQGYASALDDATYHLLPINTGNSTRISSRALDPPGISDFSFPISNRAKTTCRPFFQPSPRTSPADDFHLSCRYCPEASRCRFFHVQPILRLHGTAGLWHTPCHKPLRIQAAYARQSVEETEFAPWEIW